MALSSADAEDGTGGEGKHHTLHDARWVGLIKPPICHQRELEATPSAPIKF